MTPSHTRWITRMLAAAVAVAACTACSSAPRGAARPTSQPTSPQPAADGGGDLAAIAKARADSARHPYTAADVHFMSAMIGHHTQAIVMAGWAPTHGANASVRTLAERIVNAQQDEIAIMRQWLRDRRQPVPGAAPTGMKMKSGAEHEMHHEVQGGVLMPGMLSEAQLKQLDGARGTEFDRLFLTFMIQHHRGATAMVKELFGTYGAAQDETVFKFASDVNVDQTTEIARMERMLVVLMIESRSR